MQVCILQEQTAMEMFWACVRLLINDKEQVYIVGYKTMP